jgi:CRISPR-associated protein Cmr2
MNVFLVLIALGPVQDFIATARRTRDLWFGSYLLSEISKAAAYSLDDAQKGCLIFPNPTEPEKDLEANKPDELNVANVIFAEVRAETLEAAETLCQKAVEAAKKRLVEMMRSALEPRAFQVIGQDSKQRAQAQIEDVLEAYYAITQVKNDNYREARDRVDAMLKARKSVRNFDSSHAWAKAGVPKSSLDGAREIVTPDNDQQLERLGLRRGERLCGVGLLKRLGVRALVESNQPPKRFSSTSSVAAAVLVTEKNAPRVQNYFRKINDLNGGDERDLINITGAAFFKERLEEILDKGAFKPGKDPKREQQIEEANDQLECLLKDLTLQGKKPLPYYALLLADGDNMGATIDNIQTASGHREFSKLSAGFASQAKTIVENAQGSLVYAGGDDVLALIPLHRLLECTKQLEQAFDQCVGHLAPQQYTTAKGEHPTLSAGVVIVHHLEPLQDALELVRKAEKSAKAVVGKNALCVILSKRSGADLEVKGKFTALIQQLEESTDAFVNDELPDGVAYQLRDLCRDLPVSTHTEAQLAEAKRIFKRKEGSKEHIAKLIGALEGKMNPRKPKEDPLGDLVSALIVARELAKAKTLRKLVAPEEFDTKGAKS